MAKFEVAVKNLDFIKVKEFLNNECSNDWNAEI